MHRADNIETLVSLPPGSASHFADFDPHRAETLFVTSDPPGSQLGSGGGTAHVLREALDTSDCDSLHAWLGKSRKLLIHGSGQSRRLPAYAAAGKPLTPIPMLHDIPGQKLDQNLLDLQIQAYERIFWHAPEQYRLMVTCGDVLIRDQHWIGECPDADVVIVGLPAPPEEAERHGVLVCKDENPDHLVCFLQKPSREQLAGIAADHLFYLDTGIWLFSERAVSLLMSKCGWDPETCAFRNETPDVYDLYSAFGMALGDAPTEPDEEISAIRAAVLPMPHARFFHFGTNRSLLASVTQLCHPASEQRSFGHGSFQPAAGPVMLNAAVECPMDADNRYIWIENSHIPASWRLSHRHVLTGIPENTWDVTLPPGVCLDVAPVADARLCLRCYGFDDDCRGPLGDAATLWMGEPAADWFRRRGIVPADAGADGNLDIHEAPLFMVLAPGEIDAELIHWLIAADPADNAAARQKWLGAQRLSSRDLLRACDVPGLARQRTGLLARHPGLTSAGNWLAQAAAVDLAETADLLSTQGWDSPDIADPRRRESGLAGVHHSMFRYQADALQQRESATWHEQAAFEGLRQLLVAPMEVKRVSPRRNVLRDQIVWGRAPIRLDLGGGWTDTPPYCLEYGGCVVNAAVTLNGQPPIQVFARICEEPRIVLRSIDLGLDEHIIDFEGLSKYGQLGSGFGIARAALALAGLEPRFNDNPRHGNLRSLLDGQFGGGIELAMLAAIPKGSGLGTSSILAATLLGTLSELCGLNWTRDDVFARTMVLEQLLTSGGGWQDQVGGICGGLKMIETAAGLSQRTVIRGLPGKFFESEYANRRVLLYYTGITRVAHDILGEIVRGLFLNSGRHLSIIREIGHNARFTADAIQRSDWDGLCEAVRRSWMLNQLLDAGTNPPPVQAILDCIEDHMAACKLLGAGGGGYLLIFAKDEEAAHHIKRTLSENPPNDRARFVSLDLSHEGFQVTRS